MADIEKIKEKIEKLLNLSMSDNEHEANLALERALKLMNEHNLSKEDVYKQKLVSEQLELENRYVIHDWIVKLCANICHLSGCYMVYTQGSKKNDKLAKLIIAGRESDVLNSQYLITFLVRTIEQKSLKYKMVIRKELGSNAQNKNTQQLASYRLGLIQAITKKISDQKRMFFTEQMSNALVPMDDATRRQEAEEFFKKINTSQIDTKELDFTVSKEYYDSGRKAAEDINLNLGVNAGTYEAQKLLGV